VRRLVPLFVLVSLLAMPAAAQAKVHWLDTYEKRVKRFIGPLRTEKLDRNDPYVATVRGTFSFFAASAYDEPFCGTPDRRPVYRTRRQPNGPVNSDVEFVYAIPGRRCATQRPVFGQRFEIATASKYADHKPFGRGNLALPHPTHKYNYALIGRGRKAGFRIRESFGADNYGRIRISIRRARTRDCARGFASFGYADQATCETAVVAARP